MVIVSGNIATQILLTTFLSTLWLVSCRYVTCSFFYQLLVKLDDWIMITEGGGGGGGRGLSHF